MSMAIVRMNPMHLGHRYLIEEMGKVSDKVYIGLGSCQEYGTLKNPYTKEEREQMIRNVFPDKNKYKIFFLDDLGSCSKQEWQNYCLNELEKQCGESYPTRYFGGCEEDTTWWEGAINKAGNKIERATLCRTDNHYLSATDIRKSLRHYLAGDKNSTEWIEHIPEENIDFVKDT